MTWSEYKEEVNLLETDLSSEEEDVPIEYDQEEWQDLNSEHLLNMWMSIQSYLDTYYLRREFLGKASFNDFCEFVYKFSG